MSYAELIAASNFSFLRGASHADEMVLTAKALGLSAIAIADRNTCAGLVRAHKAAKDVGIRFVPAVRLVLDQGQEILAYPMDRAGYGHLSQTLTMGNRRAIKGSCNLTPADLYALDPHNILAVIPHHDLDQSFSDFLQPLIAAHRERLYLTISPDFRGDEKRRHGQIAAFAARHQLPLLAGNNALYHAPERRMLQDVLSAIRLGKTLEQMGYELEAHAERHLKPPSEMKRLLKNYPSAVENTLALVERCRFSLDDLRYDYPIEITPGQTPQSELIRRTWAGADERYPEGVPDHVSRLISHELEVIATLDYAPYFLTVDDIVRFARSRDILAQGRGSAANSAVCFCLGITSVDPARIDVLFERFVSAERREPPDIDVDFEHERREEVIQYIYQRYGRERAGIAATVITYRSRSAVREVGKVMGLSADMVGAWSGTVWGWSSKGVDPDHIREVGLDPDEPVIARTIALTREIIGFPRHLSQHVGGFVITQGMLDSVVPIANAAMADRTFVEWDKDDLDTLGILKIDILALGMLTCIARGLDLLRRHKQIDYDLAQVPAEDPEVYDMICKADTIGVFQIESRAQMSMLPRLKPRNFYDLVIEVAIVRPGPIQGDMVHPYLRRRRGEEPVSFPSAELEAVLGKTLGVPLFQEQAMRIAIVAAGFTPTEADKLRRAMATFRKTGLIHAFGMKLVEGMVARGYERDFAERCFRQIEGFGEYGFPESHAASFALLVYVSAWLKHHHPDIFACALLNAQPMGFYAPAQIVRDARNHGVWVRPVDINASDWDCTIEEAVEGKDLCVVRLGFRQIKGFSLHDAERLMVYRQSGYRSLRDIWLKTGFSRAVLERLAEADVFASLGLSRRAALWEIEALGPAPLPLFAAAEHLAAHGGTALIDEAPIHLPPMGLGHQVAMDYARLRLSLKAHPMAFLRDSLAAQGRKPISILSTIKDGSRLSIGGLVTVRQRPGTAKGVIFATLEDETGTANVIIWPRAFELYRRIVLGARVLGVRGRVQREGIVIHLIADHLDDLTPYLTELVAPSCGAHRPGRVLDGALAHADEVRRDPRQDMRGHDVRDQDVREMTKGRLSNRGRRAAKIAYPSRDFH